MQRRSVAGESLESADLIAVAVEGAEANAQVFQVRDGILAERHGFYLANEAERDEAEVTEEFLAQYYSAAPAVPRLVVVGPALRERAELLAEALSARRGGPVEVRVAERGDKRRLRELAERNATLALAQDRLRRERRRSSASTRSRRSRRRSALDALPVRIEGFDVSNLGGEHTVASMVVFEGGAPKKSDYRRFRDPRRPRGAGPDDFSSIEEVLGAPGRAAARAGRPLAARRRARRELRRGPRPDRDRRRQGPALGRDAGARAAGRARRRR